MAAVPQVPANGVVGYGTVTKGQRLGENWKIARILRTEEPFMDLQTLSTARVFIQVHMSLIKRREERLRGILSKLIKKGMWHKSSALSSFICAISVLCLSQRPRCIKIDGNPYAIAVGRMLVNQTQMEKSKA